MASSQHETRARMRGLRPVDDRTFGLGIAKQSSLLCSHSLFSHLSAGELSLVGDEIAWLQSPARGHQHSTKSILRVSP